MKALLCLVICGFTTVAATGGDTGGIAPKPKPVDYQNQVALQRFAVAASRMSRVDVAREFASDLNRGYLVVEVAIYPEQGQSVTIDPARLFLRLKEDGQAIRPADPRDIARSLQKASAGDRDVTVHPSIGVGWESGGRYDPSTGQYSRGGWSTDVGVGVGVGRGGPGGTDEDRKVMELELKDKSIPKGTFSKPVSGYIYFPAPKELVNSVILDMTIDDQSTKLTLPRK